jgi:acyl-CoA reductase-like NAD-dependent aldehyde dehydrogenase
MVAKPASTTPLTTLCIARILEEAGLPPGVLNIVTGYGDDVGEALVSHPGIAKVSFTGSCATGARVRELAAVHPKELILELGGSDPMIVMDDADPEQAAEGAVRGRFYNAGQTCTAVKRIYVQEKIAPEFTRILKERIDALNVGNGLGPKTDMGPLNSAAGRERIEQIVGQVRDKNEGTIVAGGTILRGKAYEPGFFYHPTLVTDVVPKSCLVTEEVFGPVLPVMTVPDLDSAIAAANASRYALGASVWTKNLHTVKRVFDEVQAGVVWANRHLTLPPEVPFGGMGESGTGRENGHHAVEQYSRTKTLLMNW